jgi:hypothetical protein
MTLEDMIKGRGTRIPNVFGIVLNDGRLPNILNFSGLNSLGIGGLLGNEPIRAKQVQKIRTKFFSVRCKTCNRVIGNTKTVSEVHIVIRRHDNKFHPNHKDTYVANGKRYHK